MKLLLGLDIGTTTIKAALYDADLGRVVRLAARPTPVSHPRPEWSEHDPQQLWRAAADCIREAARGKAVRGLAISSMAEAGLLVGPDGAALTPIIAWYDRRSEPQAAWIEQRIPVDALYRITGQRASPSFGVTKLLWAREHLPDAFARAERWLPVPAYLLWRLCGAAAVDYTIASRTLLFDQPSLGWSDRLLEEFELSPWLLPPARLAGTALGALTPQAAAETGLPRGVVCALGGHDHLCASLAAGALQTGAVIDSTGSANALLMLTPTFLPDPALGQRGFASYASLLPGRYALKGGLKAAGSAIEWLAKQLSTDPDAPDYASLEAAAAEGVGRRAGPVWLPHLIGSGTPQGDRFSRAAVVGMQLEHGPGDLFRGLLESLAFWTRHNLEAMQGYSGLPVESLSLTGGVTRLRLLSQLKADVLGRPVQVSQAPEAAAAGAALLAGLGCGVFTTPAEALASLRYPTRGLEPDPARAAWYEALYQEVYVPLYAALQPVNQAIEALNRRARPAG